MSTRATKKSASADTETTTPSLRYFRNVSPIGALWLPLTGDGNVPRGAIVTVPADRAHRIADQDVWEEVEESVALAELASSDSDGEADASAELASSDFDGKGDSDGENDNGSDDQGEADASAENQGE